MLAETNAEFLRNVFLVTSGAVWTISTMDSALGASLPRSQVTSPLTGVPHGSVAETKRRVFWQRFDDLDVLRGLRPGSWQRACR